MQELYDTYGLQRLAEDYPETRVIVTAALAAAAVFATTLGPALESDVHAVEPPGSHQPPLGIQKLRRLRIEEVSGLEGDELADQAGLGATVSGNDDAFEHVANA